MMHALTKRVLAVSGSVMVILLTMSIASITLAWFDQEADGYLRGAPSNGRLGYTHDGTYVRAWTLDMRWATTYYVRRDNNPRIDITADCDSGTGADYLHVVGWFSNLPGKSFQSWNDCGSIAVKEEGEIYFDKNGISTSTNYEANVIFQKKGARTGGGVIDHSYQRSSGSDPKVCGRSCGDLNHDWLAKSKFDFNYNFTGFEPPEAGWTTQRGSSYAYASEIDVTQRDDVMRIIPEAPFSIFVTKDGEHTRAYIEADFTNPTARQAYAQWNATKVSSVLLNASWPVPVKVTFRAPLSITDAQKLVDVANLILDQVIFVGRDRHNQPYSGGVFIDKTDSKISLGVLEAIWAEKGIRLDGVMVVEGSLDQPEALALLLKSPGVYLVDITASWVPQQLNIADLQGIVVPSPYWWLYTEWLNQHSK